MSLEELSDLNMARFYRYELDRVKQGRRLDIGSIRALLKLKFIRSVRSPSSRYELTPRAEDLLEGSL